MAQNPCLKLYEFMKKPQVVSALQSRWSDQSGGIRFVSVQIEEEFHLFETVTGTTKLTIW